MNSLNRSLNGLPFLITVKFVLTTPLNSKFAQLTSYFMHLTSLSHLLCEHYLAWDWKMPEGILISTY